MFLKDRDLLKTIIGIMIGTQMTSLSANLMNQFIKPLAQFMTVLIIKLFTFNTASVSFVEINFSLIDIVTTIGTVLLTVYAIYLIWKFSTTEASVIYTYTNNLITTYTEYYAKHPA
jgi:Na+/H+ antiporter NhaA